jgi:hypothetical protein
LGERGGWEQESDWGKWGLGEQGGIGLWSWSWRRRRRRRWW